MDGEGDVGRMTLSPTARDFPKALQDYAMNKTGPEAQAFVSQVQACAEKRCSGHGLCIPVDSANCVCDAGYSGAQCASRMSLKTTDSAAHTTTPKQAAVLDVTTFGADSTDAQPSDDAINAAIAIVLEKGGMSTLLFPPGLYRVDAPLLPLSGHNIVIDGGGALIDWRNITDHSALLRFESIAENATEHTGVGCASISVQLLTNVYQ